MKNILIVCSANKTRSPMAMEIANDISKRKNAEYVFTSGGFAVIGDSIDENVKTVLSEIGITTTWRPRLISDYNIENFDAIHVMSQRQKITLCSYFNGSDISEKITVLGVENPFSNGINAYRNCRDELMKFYLTYITTKGV